MGVPSTPGVGWGVGSTGQQGCEAAGWVTSAVRKQTEMHAVDWLAFLHSLHSRSVLSCVAGAQGGVTLWPATRDSWDSISLLVLAVDENRTFLGGN